MAERKVYLYRLVVTLPAEAAEPGWEPQAWLDDEDNHGPWNDFHWPKKPLYKSASGARKRADLFRSYGAEVTVRRSEPVTWPEVPE